MGNVKTSLGQMKFSLVSFRDFCFYADGEMFWHKHRIQIQKTYIFQGSLMHIRTSIMLGHRLMIQESLWVLDRKILKWWILGQNCRKKEIQGVKNHVLSLFMCTFVCMEMILHKLTGLSNSTHPETSWSDKAIGTTHPTHLTLQTFRCAPIWDFCKPNFSFHLFALYLNPDIK